jgi:vancomycin permeability regulator SanA
MKLPQFPAMAGRALAGFFGAFALGNLIRESVSNSSRDLNVWWIGSHWMSPGARNVVLLISGLFLIAFAVRARMGSLRKWITLTAVAILMALTTADSVVYRSLLACGTIRAGLLPLSLWVDGCLALIMWSAWWTQATEETGVICQRQPLLAVGIALAVLMIIFPLVQMFLFGKTDYRRQADCAVVFGARAYADGRPSVALADRVRTACQLYKDGLVKKLIFSGGPGDGDVHETEAMRRMALKLGIPDDAIILDRGGVNTRATVEQTREIFERIGARRIIAVSHFYHLPRVKLAYQQSGIEVYTVPARESYVLTKMPLLMAREVAAWWTYWLT